MTSEEAAPQRPSSHWYQRVDESMTVGGNDFYAWQLDLARTHVHIPIRLRVAIAVALRVRSGSAILHEKLASVDDLQSRHPSSTTSSGFRLRPWSLR